MCFWAAEPAPEPSSFLRSFPAHGEQPLVGREPRGLLLLIPRRVEVGELSEQLLFKRLGGGSHHNLERIVGCAIDLSFDDATERIVQAKKPKAGWPKPTPKVKKK